MSRKIRKTVIATAAIVAIAQQAEAVLTFNVEPNGWPSATQRQAAIDAMQSTVNRYNAYGDFGNYNVYVYYNSGIPTAQANYLGSIGFGGTYPNERVAMHELAHYLGSGTYGTPWDGSRGEANIDQFDGLEATLHGDTQHFWPYGLNYDSEGAEVNKQRQVAMIYAQRADMGIGSTANPWSATSVNLTASGVLGESGFNYASTWSDAKFAHPGATYTTGNFTLRTPASSNSFTFAGDSLRVNNTNGINGGLLYKGTGTAGVMTFKNLILDGGYVRHANSSSDIFRLNGKVTLAGTSNSTIDAAQGAITIAANIGGTGSLTKTGSFPLLLSGENTYSGSTTISAGILRLSPVTAVANYTFDSVTGSSVINGGSGGSSMNGTLANGATIVGGGRFGNAVSLSGGASVDINSPITNLNHNSAWTVSAWVKTTTAGASILTKGDGGWTYGNTIFYLGDGTGPGSGSVPSGVRWAGGFFQGSTGATSVTDNNWHQVAYVNDGGGTWTIYVDGVQQALSSGNASFSNVDVGSLVRLGVSTNTVASDGTVNYNGLLDSVQFYSQALTAAQVAALYQGQNPTAPQVLPSTTDVTIASGATLDVNGMTQTIASLSGPTGANVALGAGQLTVSSANSTQFSGAISGSGSLIKAGTGALTLAGANSYAGPTTVNGGTLRISTTGSLSSAAAVTVNGGTLDVAAGRSAAVKLASLSIGAGGNVDVNDNDLVIGSATSKSAIEGYVASARNGGDWNGNGITSSAARSNATTGLGVLSGSEYTSVGGTGTFSGQTYGATDTLVKYTWNGDANFDGRVTFDDYVKIDTGFNTGLTGWLNGDFNYSGSVNFDDYVLIDIAFNQQNGTLSRAIDWISGDDRSGSGRAATGVQEVIDHLNEFGSGYGAAFLAAVPEPSAVLLLGLPALVGIVRRRRYRARS